MKKKRKGGKRGKWKVRELLDTIGILWNRKGKQCYFKFGKIRPEKIFCWEMIFFQLCVIHKRKREIFCFCFYYSFKNVTQDFAFLKSKAETPATVGTTSNRRDTSNAGNIHFFYCNKIFWLYPMTGIKLCIYLLPDYQKRGLKISPYAPFKTEQPVSTSKLYVWACLLEQIGGFHGFHAWRCKLKKIFILYLLAQKKHNSLFVAEN